MWGLQKLMPSAARGAGAVGTDASGNEVEMPCVPDLSLIHILTGQLAGLGLMIVGLILLLSTLMIYNKPFEDTKKRL